MFTAFSGLLLTELSPGSLRSLRGALDNQQLLVCRGLGGWRGRREFDSLAFCRPQFGASTDSYGETRVKSHVRTTTTTPLHSTPLHPTHTHTHALLPVLPPSPPSPPSHTHTPLSLPPFSPSPPSPSPSTLPSPPSPSLLSPPLPSPCDVDVTWFRVVLCGCVSVSVSLSFSRGYAVIFLFKTRLIL